MKMIDSIECGRAGARCQWRTAILAKLRVVITAGLAVRESNAGTAKLRGFKGVAEVHSRIVLIPMLCNDRSRVLFRNRILPGLYLVIHKK